MSLKIKEKRLTWCKSASAARPSSVSYPKPPWAQALVQQQDGWLSHG